jgi:hypothetical protein
MPLKHPDHQGLQDLFLSSCDPFFCMPLNHPDHLGVQGLMSLHVTQFFRMTLNFTSLKYFQTQKLGGS